MVIPRTSTTWMPSSMERSTSCSNSSVICVCFMNHPPDIPPKSRRIVPKIRHSHFKRKIKTYRPEGIICLVPAEIHRVFICHKIDKYSSLCHNIHYHSDNCFSSFSFKKEVRSWNRKSIRRRPDPKGGKSRRAPASM